MSRIIQPNDNEIEFRIATIPRRGYGVVCTACELDPHAKKSVWYFSTLGASLVFQKEHRREHFGFRADT